MNNLSFELLGQQSFILAIDGFNMKDPETYHGNTYKGEVHIHITPFKVVNITAIITDTRSKDKFTYISYIINQIYFSLIETIGLLNPIVEYNLTVYFNGLKISVEPFKSENDFLYNANYIEKKIIENI